MSCWLEKGLTLPGETNSLASFVFGSTALNVRCYAEQKALTKPYVISSEIVFDLLFQMLWQSFEKTFWILRRRKRLIYCKTRDVSEKSSPNQSQMEYHNNIFTKSGVRPFKLYMWIQENIFWHSISLEFGISKVNPKKVVQSENDDFNSEK